MDNLLASSPKSARTFACVVALVSRRVSRLLRYGKPPLLAAASVFNLEVNPVVPADAPLWAAWDNAHRDEPVEPINQLLFNYGPVNGLGHFVSAHRVDLLDGTIPYPPGTAQEERLRFWWLQDSFKGVKLYHEDQMPTYFLCDSVRIIALRMPTSVRERQSTMADSMDEAINNVLRVAGLDSLGPIERLG